MKYGAILLLLAAISGRADAADPMDALQFFVGTWSCSEHQSNKPSLSSTFTFVMESGLLRQWIVRPKQGSMRAPYVVNSTFAYDSTHRRYVQTEMDNEAAWWVSAAESWQGDTLHWVDLSTSTTLSRWVPASETYFFVAELVVPIASVTGGFASPSPPKALSI
jgi:hypothetical protein